MSNLKISVVTPSIRKDGLKIVRDSIQKQTFKDFEWLIGSPFVPFYKGEAERHTRKREKLYGYGILSHTPTTKWILDDFRNGFWTLNRIYNKLFKQARGELIVSWQDYIATEPDALEKFWINYEKTNGIITGVGDQYEGVNKFNQPEIKIWSDPRKTDTYGSFYEINWNDAEWNWCAIPREYIFKVGGMDEKLDFLGFGGDQMQICQRMNALGVKFFIDQTNESYTIRHSRDDFGGQEEWDKNHVLFNGKYHDRVKELIELDKWPCIGYL